MLRAASPRKGRHEPAPPADFRGMAPGRSSHGATPPGGEVSRVRDLWVLTALPPFGFLAPLSFAYAPTARGPEAGTCGRSAGVC